MNTCTVHREDEEIYSSIEYRLTERFSDDSLYLQLYVNNNNFILVLINIVRFVLHKNNNLCYFLDGTVCIEHHATI